MQKWIVYTKFTDGSEGKRVFRDHNAADIFYERVAEKKKDELVDLSLVQWLTVRSGWNQ